jgi:hypothetical protein|tara:strand:+ start:424 stop:603 length:180 start_codon:yes stop_codon:yes gene_type:complete
MIHLHKEKYMDDYRDKLLDLIDDGLLDARLAVLCLVKYMSQDDVKDCMKVNELLEEVQS